MVKFMFAPRKTVFYFIPAMPIVILLSLFFAGVELALMELFITLGVIAYIVGLLMYKFVFRGFPSWGVKLAICCLIDIFDFHVIANLPMLGQTYDIIQTLVCTALVGPLGALCMLEVLIPSSVGPFQNWLPLCAGACLISWRYRIRF